MDSHQPKGANSCPPITCNNDELDQLNLCRSFLMNLVLTWARIKKSRVAAEVGERLSAIQRHRHQPFNHLREVFFRELSWQIKFDLLKFVCSHLFRSKVGDPLWEWARLLEPVHLGLLLQVVLHLGEDHVQHRYNDIISSTLSSFSPLQHYTVDITNYGPLFKKILHLCHHLTIIVKIAKQACWGERSTPVEIDCPFAPGSLG